MQAHHVGLAKQLVQRLGLLAPRLRKLLGRLRGRPHHDAHAQRPRDRGHLARDAPKEHKPQRLAIGAVDRIAHLGVPATGKDVPVREGDLAHEVEHECHRVRGDVLRAIARAVAHQHAARGQSFHVHVVEADRHAGHEPDAGVSEGVDLLADDGHELADDGLAALELAAGGRAERLVREADKLDAAARTVLGEDLVGPTRVAVERVVEDAMGLAVARHGTPLSSFLAIIGPAAAA